MKDQILIIGLVVSLTAGFLIGRLSTPVTVSMPQALPSNYDPARAMANDVMKAERESSERCWKQVVSLLDAQAKEKAATH